jgi:succinate dehydrogenase/fumarate reductase flavoprotein subunit
MEEERTALCDVLVVGSGAGGLAAAVTARRRGLDVLVVEKEPWFGGTTARSGGWLWIPGNPVSAREGLRDSREAARTYLQHEAGNHFDPERVDAFLENGPRMVEFFERETAVRFVAGPSFSDYHPDAPGGVPGGRSICAAPFDARELGPLLGTLRPPLAEITFVGMMIGTGRELQHFFNVTRSLRSAAFVAWRLLVHGRDLLVFRRALRLTNGNALAARLGRSAADLGVKLWLGAPARELLVEGGRIAGALVEKDGAPVRVAARRGVVLACGGFPHDVERRRALFPHAPSGTEHASPAPPGNTGDGLRLGEAAGAAVDESLPNAAAWVPVSRVPRPGGAGGIFPHFVDRAKPGVIAVTRRGRRFVNEADSYHDFVQAMARECAAAGDPDVAAWLVADHRTIRRYGLGFVKPFPLPLGPHLRSGYLLRGATPQALACRAGIDEAALAATLVEYNRHAARGRDPAYGKGGTAYNRSLGDPKVAPNPCVAPVAEPPFYAVKLVVGDLGTFAGLRTDRFARVLRADGAPIAGLYAAGNDMASIMGGNYPGGGITLGPALTFGYIAARHLASLDPQGGKKGRVNAPAHS